MTGTLHHQILTTIIAAICAGIGLIVFARKRGLPAIILLLTCGIVLGPEVTGVVNADSLGPVLPVFVSLAVGIILFEGGLTLDLAGYRSASKFIRRLVSLGVLISWLLTAAAIYLIAGQGVSFALLAASLVVVTGPTVIAPLLKRIRLKENLESILKWEAVLVDPIGVFIAVLCFEWIVHGSGGRALAHFALRVVCGLGVGMVGGLLVYHLLKRRQIPEQMVSVGVLGGAVLTFGVSELLFSEAGLLASIVGGLVLAICQPDRLKQIRQFKSEITDLMIGMLFILLASRLKLSQFELFGWTGLILVAVVLFVIRPVTVLSCAKGLDFTWREKAFLGWIAPRGIVAASMASLVRITLEQRGIETHSVASLLASVFGFSTGQGAINSAAFVETFTYSVIVATIVLHGFSAGPLAKLLGLQRPIRNGWLIVGGHRIGWEIAGFIREATGLPVYVADSNPENLADRARLGLQTIQEDARHTAAIEQSSGGCVGNVLALTDNEDLNVVVCQHWSEIVGAHHVYRWHSGRGTEEVEKENPGHIIWHELPKPGAVSAQIKEREARIVRTANPSPPSAQHVRFILAVTDRHTMWLDPEPENNIASNRPLYYLVIEMKETVSAPDTSP